MKTLARFTMAAAIAVGTIGCLGPTSMPRVTPDGPHAEWLARATPLLGTWIDGIENEYGWVDVLQADGDVLVLAGRAREARSSVRFGDSSSGRLRFLHFRSSNEDALKALEAAKVNVESALNLLPGTEAKVWGRGTPAHGYLRVWVYFSDSTEEYGGELILDPAVLRARHPTRADMSGTE